MLAPQLQNDMLTAGTGVVIREKLLFNQSGANFYKSLTVNASDFHLMYDISQHLPENSN